MSNIHVNDYGEYVIRLRDTFRTATEMPSYKEKISDYAGTKTLTFKIIQKKVDYKGSLTGEGWK